MTQLSLKYPDHPGAKVAGPSADAANDVAGDAPKLRARTINVLHKAGPLTADEVAGHLGLDRLAIRPRVSELKRLGLIQDSGSRRLNSSGKMATCWEVAR